MNRRSLFALLLAPLMARFLPKSPAIDLNGWQNVDVTSWYDAHRQVTYTKIAPGVWESITDKEQSERCARFWADQRRAWSRIRIDS